TARMGGPFVKKFVEERELTVLIATDISASQQFGTASLTKAELAAELSALLAFAAVASNDLVGLLTFTDRVEAFVPPAKGPRHALRLVRELLGARPAGRGTDIGAALNYIQRALPRRAIVFLISDFMDDGFEATLRSTARRHDVIALALGDPREVSLPSIGLVEVVDPETGERAWLDTGDERVRRGFDEQAMAATSERGYLLKSLGVDVVSLATDQDYIAPLTAYLQARARRR
ncbi:MAG: VWA domain-containing protein, partial [Chloroflexi bacterium]|nr:VWA domain-containing protein [Chloroflexota bacterium]